MKIKIFGSIENTKELINKVNESLEDLWLDSFVEIEITNDKAVKKELNIKKEPALIIEEEAIDFIDIIYEWVIPDIEELKSMLISIIWWNSTYWCWLDQSWCPTWCSC